jgi:hypothetical protein
MKKSTVIALLVIAFTTALSPAVANAQPVCAYPAQWVWRGYWSCEYPVPAYYPSSYYYPYYGYPFASIGVFVGRPFFGGGGHFVGGFHGGGGGHFRGGFHGGGGGHFGGGHGGHR